MNIVSNIEEKILKLEAIAAGAQRVDVSDALTAGVNAARGQMQNRIFNQGLDASNETLGRYIGRTSKTTERKFASSKSKRKKLTKHRQFSDSLAFTPYEKERLAAGRQITYKDLEFRGSLRRSIVTAKEGSNKVVCIINNPAELAIAQYQEEQIASIRATGRGNATAGRVKIFSLSTEERTILKETVTATIKQQYDRLLNTK